jgi:oxalate---CoA ligase
MATTSEAEGSRTIRAAMELCARRAPLAPALEAPGRRALTFEQAFSQIQDVNAQLNALGIGRNDVVALMLPNGPEMALAFLAIASTATCAPLNPTLRPDDARAYLSMLRPRAMVGGKPFVEAHEAVARELGIELIELLPISDSGAGVFRLKGNPRGEPRLSGFAESGDVALVLPTSGTTSKPKMVPLTHANLMASARHIKDSLQLGENDKRLNVMPLFHVQGLVGGVLSCVAAGGSIVCAPTFSPALFFRWLEEFRPSWYSAVPAMHQLLMAEASNFPDIVKNHRLRFLRVGSYALSATDHARLESIFGVPAVESYGMTETASQIAVSPLPPGRRKHGTVGLVSGPEVIILDARGDPATSRVIGEIAVRGPNVMRGYLHARTSCAAICTPPR